jgi:hypothetical protein
MTSQVQDNFVEQIGWPNLVATVADIYTALPDEERAFPPRYFCLPRSRQKLA